MIPSKKAAGCFPEMSGDNDLLATTEAKLAFFLTSDDIRDIKHRSLARGGRTGPPLRLYHVDDLRAAAVRKYGEIGLQTKEESRKRRESKKRRLQDGAEHVHVLTGLPLTAPASSAATGVVNAAVVVGDATDNAESRTANHRLDDRAPVALPATPQEIASLRASLLKLAKKAVCLMDGNSQKVWSVDVPCVQPDVVAALAGRTADAGLQSGMKMNKSYSMVAHACELFGCNEADLLHVFYRDGVGIQILDSITLCYKPSNMTLTVQGEGELVCDQRTMWI